MLVHKNVTQSPLFLQVFSMTIQHMRMSHLLLHFGKGEVQVPLDSHVTVGDPIKVKKCVQKKDRESPALYSCFCPTTTVFSFIFWLRGLHEAEDRST